MQPHTLVRTLALVLATSALVPAASAADQTGPGAGNANASQLVARTPRVIEAHRFLVDNATRIQDAKLRAATLDLLRNPGFCITSRVGVGDTT